MNRDNIEEILKSIGAETVPPDVHRIAQETSNNFSRSVTEPSQPDRPVLLEYIMRNRMPKLAAAAMIVVAVLIGLNTFSDNGVAWSKVLENVEQVRAYVHRTRMTVSRDNQADAHVEFIMHRSMDYGMRRDSYDSGQLISQLYLARDAANCLELVPSEKKYVKTTLTEQQLTEMREKQDPRELVKLLTCFEQKPLGRKTIDGRECEGVEVDDPKFGRMIFEAGKGRIWADVRTELPVLIELEGTSAGGAIRIHLVLDQFDWAAALTAEDFEPNIPDDYTVWAEVDLTGSAETMVKGLRGFSNVTGGKYPSSLDLMTANSEVQGAFVRGRQKQGISLEQPPSKEEMDNILAIQGACMYYGQLIGEDKDVAYYGNKVTAEFPHAVLMRWKCGEDSYCVIFADLNTRNVTSEELIRLEATPLNINLHAIKPEPADGAAGTVLTGLKLSWLPGAEALQHNVYFGTSPDGLSLLVTEESAECDKVPPLQSNTTYYWRVDAISADGKITPGAVWSFSSGGLVAHWAFDEGSGNVVADAGPNRLDGATLGNPTWVTGVLGSALQFDGDGDYVDFGNYPKFDIANQITISAWIKVGAFDRQWQTIIAKGDSAWRLQRNAAESTLEFACTGPDVPGSPWGNLFGSAKVDDDRWHHVAGTYDGSRMCLYVDGTLDASANAVGTINVNEYSVCIGENAEKPERFWNGLIDDVRIYNYALGADEIAAAASLPETE